MLNLILLVQSQHDLDHLLRCSEAMKRAGVTNCWTLYSPAVLADSQTVNAEFDKQIAALNEAINRAKATEDFDACKGYKEQREGVVLAKSAAAKDAYKSLTPEQQQAAAARIFAPFYESKPAPNLKISRHSEHYETGNWLEMVNSLRGAWLPTHPAGDFIVTWPGQVAQWGTSPVVSEPVVSTTPSAPPAPTPATSPAIVKAKAPSKSYTSTKRFKILCAMGIEALGHEAIAAGIAQPSGNRLSIAHKTIQAEIAKAGGVLPE